MRRSIVCGVDGSPDAQAALAIAREFAERLGNRLILAHVAEPVAEGEHRGERLGL